MRSLLRFSMMLIMITSPAFMHAQTNGSISGTVYYDDGITPFPDAYINIWNENWTRYASDRTDAQGHYIFYLPSGNYYVQADAPTYDWKYYRDTFDQSKAALVTVIAPNAVTNIDISLSKGSNPETGSISGTVYENDGATPISDTQVYIYDLQWNQLTGGSTDTNGRYHFDLDSGNYYVEASGMNNQWQKVFCGEYYDNSLNQTGATPVTVNLNTETSGINFSLEKNGTITGTVYQNDGVTPIKGAWVGITSFCYSYTDSYGHYTIYAFPGSHHVRANGYLEENDQQEYALEYFNNTPYISEATLFPITTNSTVTGIDFTLDEGGTISGMVYQNDGVTPIIGAQVIAKSSEPLLEKVDDGLHFSDSSGHYTLRVLAGTYYVSATGYISGQSNQYQMEYYNNSTEISGATLVSVTEGNETTGVDFSLIKNTTDVTNQIVQPVPKEFTLLQNYPNPFNPTTHIQYALPVTSSIELAVFSLDGRRVCTLMHNKQNAGVHEVIWDGRTDSGAIISSGIYYIRLQAGDYTFVKKMLFTK